MGPKMSACAYALNLAYQSVDLTPALTNHYRPISSTLTNHCRPITLVVNAPFDQDQGSQHYDIITVNRYHHKLYAN